MNQEWEEVLQGMENQDTNFKEFGIWLQNGIDRGWVTEPFCMTHDGDPYMNEEEAQEWEEGGDPCSHVIKFKDI